jgi:tetratricopeptide (TPR) repeat protein
VLLGRGRDDVAVAIARLAPPLVATPLSAHLASRTAPTREADAATRAALREAVEAMTRKAPGAAVAAIDRLPAPAGSILEVRAGILRGGALRDDRRVPEAIDEFLRTAERAERLGWLDVGMRTAMEAGSTALASKDLAKAVTAYERARRMALAMKNAGAALFALSREGGAHQALGNFPKATEALEGALSEAEAMGQRAWIAQAETDLAILYFTIGDGTKAVPHAERALTGFEQVGDRNAARRAKGNLALALSLVGEHELAAAMQQEVLAQAEAAGDRVGASDALANLGRERFSLGEFATALDAFERAEKAKRDLGHPERAAGLLGNVGLVLLETGDLEAARTTLEEAHARLVRLKDRPAAAAMLGNVAKARFLLGDYAGAFAAGEEAIEQMRAMGDRGGIASLRAVLGALHDQLGDGRQALVEQKAALVEWEVLGDPVAAARALVNVGNAKATLGDDEGSLEAYRGALERILAAGRRPDEAGARANLALALDRVGRRDDAVAEAKRALAAVVEPDSPERIRILNVLASLRREKGDLDDARQGFTEAAEAAEKQGSLDTLALALLGLARVEADASRWEEALVACRRAVPVVERSRARLGDEQGAAARGAFADLYSVGLLASARLGRVDDASDFLESGRARGLLESLGSRAAIQGATLPPALRDAEAAARRAEARAAQALAKARAGGERASVRDAVKARDDAVEAVAAVVERIQREAKREASVLYPKVRPLAQTRASLAPDEAIVVYGFGGDDLLALVATSSEARLVPLGRAETVLAAAQSLHLDDAAADPALATAALRAAIAEPLRLPATVRRVRVSPDGGLAYLPFSLLFPDAVVTHVPSATVDGLLREEGASRGTKVLALGDPDYAAARAAGPAARSGTGGAPLPPLPATRDEARAVGDRVLLGHDATEARFRAVLGEEKRWRAVHFATHGLVDPERPAFSALALTPAEGDDGLLRSLEVLRLRCPADLVVMSACETARGKAFRAEGLVGLARSFMFAGSPRVLCSLWKVDDEATQALMTRFYAAWNPKDGSPPRAPAEALKAAQEAVRDHEVEAPDPDASAKAGRSVRRRVRPWSHPRFWAAWVLWGLGD